MLKCEKIKEIGLKERRKKFLFIFIDLERQSLLPTYPNGIKIM